MDQICEGGTTSGEALEQPEEILKLIDQPGTTSGEALEQSEGMLQLIDQPGNTSGVSARISEHLLNSSPIRQSVCTLYVNLN